VHTFSGYHINHLLYESNKTLVYRACRQQDEEPVVLKVLRDDYPSPGRIAWFKREFEITRSLAFDGVPHIYTLDTEQNYWFMAMQDTGGSSITRLGLAGTLKLFNFLPLALKIVDNLAQIHQRQIMHKDINPSNIVYNPDTGDVKIIDFGIASMLSRETTSLYHLNMLEGTLAYMSPEQTGRMNRAVDYRTDFYSLGVTLYELLTGSLPFVCQDALEMVHAHIVRQPVPPHQHVPTIPPALSAIILKLMAKNAEDRYQSAYGLKADLEQQYAALTLQAGEISDSYWLMTETFQPGQKDVNEHFSIPQKLYGRGHEIHTLLQAFECVCQGARELMLVTGEAGIGKTALVQEVYKPMTRQKGYFVSGKFDQFQRDIPYAAFIQAFRSLVRQLLTESDNAIAAWSDALQKSLGATGRVIVDVIPELELIVGAQPPIAALPPSEAQHRLARTFQCFIQVFSKQTYPLVIFLDDLQWADASSEVRWMVCRLMLCSLSV